MAYHVFSGTRERVHFCLRHCNDGGLGTLKFTVNSPCVPLLLFWSAVNAAGIAPKHSDRHKIVFACAYKFERLLSHRSHGQLGTVNRSSSMTPTALRVVPGPHGQLGTVKGQRISLACHGNDFAGWQRPGRVVLPDGGQEVCTGAREGSGLLMP